jgi:hypothetical protein
MARPLAASLMYGSMDMRGMKRKVGRDEANTG